MSKAKRASVSLGGSRRISKVALGFEDATPERLSRAMGRGDVPVDSRGVRLIADPFDVLRNRQCLDRVDQTRNGVLWLAGDRFRRHWHLGRLDALTAFDFSRETVDGTGGAGASTPTEAALRHRDAYRAACEIVGARLLPVLIGFVIEGKCAADLRPLVTDTSHDRTAEALVIERLREALDRLCCFWGTQGSTRRSGGPRPTGVSRELSPD
ncbi:hypothetical protein [Lichenihabitans psoromatis]|uniref:hypothetical protein n=1 Tax=Lichenihabitans psoromatis TaxID=2528642 RepID=UPI0010383B68|nr:hypothetical protein [Lichenihabitans psoromatis]